MKKVMILAAVAIAAMACNKTYQVVPNTTEGPAIGFSSWTAQLTKARTAGSSQFADGDNLGVYGFKSTSGATEVVFDNQEVSTEDGSTWTYTPIRYWDKKADSYTFYAVSPKDAASVVATTGAVSASVTFSGKENDILVANKNEVANADFGKPVHLVFNHAASLVDFKIKKSTNLTNATVSVSDFTLSQIFNAGTLAVSEYGNDADKLPKFVWTGSTKGTYGPGSGVTEVKYADLTDVSEDPSSDFLINTLVVMPQEFGATGEADSQQLSITYQITTGTGDAQQVIEYTHTLYLADFDTVDDEDQDDTKVAKWEPGKHYTFFITLDSNAITFTAEITDWADVINGYHYLFN